MGSLWSSGSHHGSRDRNRSLNRSGSEIRNPTGAAQPNSGDTGLEGLATADDHLITRVANVVRDKLKPELQTLARQRNEQRQQIRRLIDMMMNDGG